MLSGDFFRPTCSVWRFIQADVFCLAIFSGRRVLSGDFFRRFFQADDVLSGDFFRPTSSVWRFFQADEFCLEIFSGRRVLSGDFFRPTSSVW